MPNVNNMTTHTVVRSGINIKLVSKFTMMLQVYCHSIEVLIHSFSLFPRSAFYSNFESRFHQQLVHQNTVNRIEMVRIAGKLQRDQKCMSRTTFYFRHVIDKRYQAARELIENNGEKFDTCV